MGMFTELNISCQLDKANEYATCILEHMLMDDNDLFYDMTNKIFPEIKAYADNFEIFKHHKFHHMLKCDSYYFNHFADSSMHRRDMDNYYTLNVRCDLKNYENEIEHFLDWIITLSSDEGFVGYKRYEENENPTLIYFENGKVVYKTV